jgi:hypothetical protein
MAATRIAQKDLDTTRANLNPTQEREEAPQVSREETKDEIMQITIKEAADRLSKSGSPLASVMGTHCRIQRHRLGWWLEVPWPDRKRSSEDPSDINNSLRQ